MSVASLPMYDFPELRWATDALWAGLAAELARAGLPDVPPGLHRGRDEGEAWRMPDLLFSQTCGYPLTHALKGLVRLVATPVYAAEGCRGADYRSVFIVRADETAPDLEAMRGRRVAVNARQSQSGYNCLRRAVARIADGLPVFSEVVLTAAHLGSVTAVAEGRADLAAIDCVTFALLGRHRPEAIAGLRVLAESDPAPALPYVTRGDAGPELLSRLRRGLEEVMKDPDLADAREALLLEGVEVLPEEAYRVIDEMESEARALGYPELV
jgi:ABC-type phosphate/phosphonate transport system substrate-binding protein